MELTASTGAKKHSSSSITASAVVSSPKASSSNDANDFKKKRGRPSHNERAAMELLQHKALDDEERQPGKRGKTSFLFDENWVSVQ